MTLHREISNLADPELLEKIDKLRDLNIGQHVPLPQLVVVGDQSSGKSSLLESLTGIPFPKDQSLCTRHATQITSRRARDDNVYIRIIAGPRASEEHRKHVESFEKKVPSGQEFRSQFASILEEANERMGLRIDLSGDNGAVFSEDVLKIEVNGPNEDYLTIIDVPGIFRTTTQGTTKDDMSMVRDLVKRYIKDDRTIILAVLPSNVDIATQEILELAEEYDKSGERTLGVLTKPDLVLEASAQTAVCDLILGHKRPLNLGYFLVRNRRAGGDLLDQTDLEAMFEREPWRNLPKDRVGVPALKEQLGSLLVEITRREFPKLFQDVNTKMRNYKKELDNLGPPRQDEREQRSFLSHIAGAFQDRARAALAGDYTAESGFDQGVFRLITNVINITGVFSSDCRQKGHSYHFKNTGQPDLTTFGDLFAELNCEESPVVKPGTSLNELLTKAKVDEPTSAERAELGHFAPVALEIPMAQTDLSQWINELYFLSRGQDLGTFNPNLVRTAFAEQSRNWEAITMLYMSRVILTLHRFIAAAIQSVCTDEQSRTELWSAILDGLIDGYREAMEQASLLIEMEKEKSPYTLNRVFAAKLSKARGSRMTELLRPKARKDTKQFGETQNMVDLDDIIKAAADKSNVEQLQEEIHDILQAYYGLALDKFIDNVFQGPVDYYLLHGPSSPLKVFNQEWVINLEPKQLERIVGESKSCKKRRSKLVKKIDDLSAAMRILKT